MAEGSIFIVESGWFLNISHSDATVTTLDIVSHNSNSQRFGITILGLHSRQVIILLFVIVPFLIFSVNIQPVHAVPESHMLPVPYHAQSEALATPNNNYYCSPTSVQMVLQYISGKIVSQITLASELDIKPSCGGLCDSSMLKTLFTSRGYNLVSIDNSNLETLKELNSQGHATIINLHFDASHEIGHYVVMVGYDEKGIYVNDPWPTTWRQPNDRSSGPDAFISNSVLTDLWSRYNQWTLRVPYQAFSTVSTQSNITGIYLYSIAGVLVAVLVFIFIRKRRAAVPPPLPPPPPPEQPTQ